MSDDVKKYVQRKNYVEAMQLLRTNLWAFAAWSKGRVSLVPTGDPAPNDVDLSVEFNQDSRIILVRENEYLVKHPGGEFEKFSMGRFQETFEEAETTFPEDSEQ